MKTKIIACLISAMLLSQNAFPMTIEKAKENNPKGYVIESQWKGKRVIILGDSISDKARIGTTKCWWEYLAEFLGIKPYVYAINGSQWNNIYTQLDNMHKSLGNDIDAIIIFAGTNDYYDSLPIGSWYQEGEKETEVPGEKIEKRTHRDFIFSEETLKGRINRVMDYIKREYPTKQVILITPIHRAFAKFGKYNVQPDEMFPNGKGLFLEEYVNAIKEASNVWSVPVIDLNGTCGILPTYKSNTQYIHHEKTDRLHPNAEGHKRMALTIEYQLLQYPSSFE